MAASLYEAIPNGGSRTVQQRGVLTLPKQWREKHELEQGDLVAVIENERRPPRGHPAGGGHRAGLLHPRARRLTRLSSGIRPARGWGRLLRAHFGDRRTLIPGECQFVI